VRAITNGFWSGIDIFFVLSGFLIGRILIQDLRILGLIRWRKFFIRRSFRIFPAYYFVLLVSLFVLAPTQPGLINFLYLSADWPRIAAGAWTNFVYLNNYLLDPSHPNILSWGWSLCVEEHFYAFLPVFLWVVFRLRNAPLQLALLSLGVVVPLLLRFAAWHADPDLHVLDGLYYHSHNRFDEIFVGVILAQLAVVWPERLRRFALRAGGFIPAVGIACIALVWVAGGLQKQGFFVVVLQFLVMACGSGLLLLNGMYLDNRVTRFFAHRAWYPFARISYGTFLLHPFILMGLLTFYRGHYGPVSLGNGGMAYLTASTFAVTTAVAAVMFLVLERPLLDVGMRLSQRYAVVGGARAPDGSRSPGAGSRRDT
jgi:peptidoglycan/LPS O-acetylase OafA/YrhL